MICVRDLTRRDSRTRTSKPDRTMAHHVCEQLRYGYFGDIGQHERSKDRANRTVESLALIVLHQATPSHAEPYCSSTPQDAEPYCSPKTISNMRRGTPIVP
jgi:hypothetical protein